MSLKTILIENSLTIAYIYNKKYPRLLLRTFGARGASFEKLRLAGIFQLASLETVSRSYLILADIS